MTTILNPPDFESAYIFIRDKEKRVYSDEELRLLPNVDKLHVHSKEWQIRKATAERLMRYLQDKNKPLRILEVGCGNGWLSAQLANVKDSTVTGIDINSQELEQAKRVFKNPNLNFICQGPYDEDLKQQQFDIIIFVSSVQYFKVFDDIINNSLNMLSSDGEIHIADSIFYNDDHIDGAVKRSKDYFDKMGCPQMADWYFHRRLGELKSFNYKILADPNSVINKLLYKNPFYWITIKHPIN